MNDEQLQAIESRLERVEVLLERIAAALETAKPEKKKRTVVGEAIAPGTGVWMAYATAFHERYRVLPARNAKTNALCLQLIKRLGEIDSVSVAVFYVQRHNDRLYLNARHPLDLLVRDAEKLYADWKRGCAATSKDAAHAESLSYAQEQMGRVERGEI